MARTKSLEGPVLSCQIVCVRNGTSGAFEKSEGCDVKTFADGHQKISSTVSGGGVAAFLGYNMVRGQESLDSISILERPSKENRSLRYRLT